MIDTLLELIDLPLRLLLIAALLGGAAFGVLLLIDIFTTPTKGQNR